MDWPVSVYCTSAMIPSTVQHSQYVPPWRSQRPKLTVTPSSYCSKLIAGSICVTLKDFWIVWVGQDSCYRSLCVIECSLIDLIPDIGHTVVPLNWLLWSDHTWGEYRRALLEVISIANLWVYLGCDQCCFSRSLFWWFLRVPVCLLQSGIPGNLLTIALIILIVTQKNKRVPYCGGSTSGETGGTFHMPACVEWWASW